MIIIVQLMHIDLFCFRSWSWPNRPETFGLIYKEHLPFFTWCLASVRFGYVWHMEHFGVGERRVRTCLINKTNNRIIVKISIKCMDRCIRWLSGIPDCDWHMLYGSVFVLLFSQHEENKTTVMNTWLWMSSPGSFTVIC